MREIVGVKPGRWMAILLTALAVLVLPVAAWTAEVDINVVEQSKDDNGFLDDAANHFPNPIRVTSKADLADKVGKALKEGDCIKTLTLAGHGSPGNISTGDGQTTKSCKHIDGNRDEWEPALKGLKGKFCKGAKIVLWGCNVGACNEGAKKLHELAKFFGVTVEGQTGAVYGNGTTENGSQTQVADPASDKPPAHKSAPSVCKKKKLVKTLTPTTTTASFDVPVTSAPVSFPSSQDVYAVTFIPASLLVTAFEETDPAQPFLATATLSADGQLYVTQNAIINRSLVERATSAVYPDLVADTRKLAANLVGAVVFQTIDGQTIPYFTYGDFQYLLSGPNYASALNTDCEGLSLYRLLTWETLPYTLLDADLSPVTETLLVDHVVTAAHYAEQGLIAESQAALDRLIADTEARSRFEISPETAARIVAEAQELKADYLLLQDAATPNPDPDPIPNDPMDPSTGTDGSGKP